MGRVYNRGAKKTTEAEKQAGFPRAIAGSTNTVFVFAGAYARASIEGDLRSFASYWLIAPL